MSILKISSIKKKFNEKRRDLLEITIKNKTKTLKNAERKLIESQIKIIKYQKKCICETKYD